MGLSKDSVGMGASNDFKIQKEHENDKVIALAGNPNVGKSTLFNALTGLNQHTGNWTGKTVSNASGNCRYNEKDYIFVDLPGTYSLMAHSAEEEIARNFICFGQPDAVVVVCDATCIERNLNLLLQTAEITPNVIMCINLIDEADKKGIQINVDNLKERLKIPVVAMSARSKKGINELLKIIEETTSGETERPEPNTPIKYLDYIEHSINIVEPVLSNLQMNGLNTRWAALRLIEKSDNFKNELKDFLSFDLNANESVMKALKETNKYLEDKGITCEKLRDNIISCIILKAEEICNDSICCTKKNYNNTDRKIDRFLTNKITGIPIMLLLLAVVLWITIVGANYPSQWLSSFFSQLEGWIAAAFDYFSAPWWLKGIFVDGMFRVLFWVVAVMLPPMAIFFPLFTLLEDLGFLPRIAFNLDKYFKKSGACGKQSLTMCLVHLCYFITAPFLQRIYSIYELFELLSFHSQIVHNVPVQCGCYLLNNEVYPA